MDAPSQIKGLRGGVLNYAAREILQIDTEIAEKGHLWMETNWGIVPLWCNLWPISSTKLFLLLSATKQVAYETELS